jgi:hypothetical protein
MTRSVVLCATKLKSHKMIKLSLEAVNFELTAFNFSQLMKFLNFLGVWPPWVCRVTGAAAVTRSREQSIDSRSWTGSDQISRDSSNQVNSSVILDLENHSVTFQCQNILPDSVICNWPFGFDTKFITCLQ